MTTLLQRLGLVAGLGLAAIAMEGCERTVEVRSPIVGGNALSKPCSCPSNNSTFGTVEEHTPETKGLDIPINPNVARTVEGTRWYNSVADRGESNVGNCQLKRGLVYTPDGRIRALGPDLVIDSTGEAVNPQDYGSLLYGL